MKTRLFSLHGNQLWALPWFPPHDNMQAFLFPLCGITGRESCCRSVAHKTNNKVWSVGRASSELACYVPSVPALCMFLHALFHPTSIISSLWPSSVFTSSSSWTQPSNFSSQSLSKRPCCSRMKANSHKRWKVVARQLSTSGRFPSFSSLFKYIYILFSNSPVGSHFFNGSSVQKCNIFFHSRVKPGHRIQEKLDEISKKKKKKKRWRKSKGWYFTL